MAHISSVGDYHCREAETLLRRPTVRIVGRSGYIAFGSNASGPWGTPARALSTAVERLAGIGLHVKVVSENFMTRPVGGPRQARFVNAVALVQLTVAPAAALRGLKRLEREAGRRPGPHWGPRPLDLDLIDAGIVLGWQRRQGARRAGQLQLPHPEAHRRGFVLLPLSRIAPHWRHPVLDRGVRALLSQRGNRQQLRGIWRLEEGLG
jgi:2-amino-4-hydroxy-6-hydroxymethyldihydropteridine diphosphokinase